MRYFYWTPAPDLRELVGAYYLIEAPEGGADFVRAEIPHLRFILRGESTLSRSGRSATYRAPTALVSGPSFSAGQAMVSPGSMIIGASLTPLGWQTIVGESMRALANGATALDDIRAFDFEPLAERLLAADDDAAMFTLVDTAIRRLSERQPRLNEGFVDAAMAWLLDPHSPGIDDLIGTIELSHRQVDRLCQTYFGAPPKRLHRMFRALHVATRMAWTGETDWRQVASHQFHDQAHFIKDFKELIGCTPSVFVNGRNRMVRFDLMKRLEISHRSSLSLIG